MRCSAKMATWPCSLANVVAKHYMLASSASDSRWLHACAYSRVMRWEKSRQRGKAELSSAKYHRHPFVAGYQRTWQAVTLPACYLSSRSGLPSNTSYVSFAVSSRQTTGVGAGGKLRLIAGTAGEAEAGGVQSSFPPAIQALTWLTRKQPLPPTFWLNACFHRNLSFVSFKREGKELE